MTVRLTILALALLAFTLKSEMVINGRIYASDKPEFYSVENVFVILRSNNFPIDTVRTNDKGEFSAIIPKGKQINIDVLYSGIGFGTVYLRHIKQLSADTTDLQIDLAAAYKKNLFGTAVCSKCRKTDQVYKIRYGDPPVYKRHTNDNGDTAHTLLHKGVYGAGTCVSVAQSAQWYCKRDKIQF